LLDVLGKIFKNKRFVFCSISFCPKLQCSIAAIRAVLDKVAAADLVVAVVVVVVAAAATRRNESNESRLSCTAPTGFCLLPVPAGYKKKRKSIV